MVASNLKSLRTQAKALQHKIKAERQKQMANAPLSPKEFKQAIETFELTQEQAGVFFGASPRQGQRWAIGEAMIPNSVAIAIDLMLEHDKKPKDFYRKLHLEGVFDD